MFKTRWRCHVRGLTLIPSLTLDLTRSNPNPDPSPHLDGALVAELEQQPHVAGVCRAGGRRHRGSRGRLRRQRVRGPAQVASAVASAGMRYGSSA